VLNLDLITYDYYQVADALPGPMYRKGKPDPEAETAASERTAAKTNTSTSSGNKSLKRPAAIDPRIRAEGSPKARRQRVRTRRSSFGG
jgi:hypothetical protein